MLISFRYITFILLCCNKFVSWIFYLIGYTSSIYTVYIIILIEWITYIMYLLLQSMSADSARETKHRMEFSQHSTRSCVITHITWGVEYAKL